MVHGCRIFCGGCVLWFFFECSLIRIRARCLDLGWFAFFYLIVTDVSSGFFAGGCVGCGFLLESLILAQDERWRRA